MAGRNKNHLGPSNKFGAEEHFTAQVDSNGNPIRYSAWTPNERNPRGFDLAHRVDFVGPAHGNVGTPHVHVKKDCFEYDGPEHNFPKPPPLQDPGKPQERIPKKEPKE